MATSTPQQIALCDAAAAWHQAGVSIVPVAADGSKRPAIPWKRYQSQQPADEEAARWFALPDPLYSGLGVVCGAVSRGLELLEFEGRAVLRGLPGAMAMAMADAGERDLWTLLLSGCVELTPSGGLHLFYFVNGQLRGNTKLARRPATDAELAQHPQARFMVEIETRSEGGYAVAAPTPGTHHASGRPWVVIKGSPDTIPTITAEQRDILHAVANTLDTLPTALPVSVGVIPAPAAGAGQADGVRPGDEFNAKMGWEHILIGWRRVKRLGAGFGWRRPGKTDPGISATTGTAADGVDRLYVFSSSTEFEVETPYSKFGAYTVLAHGGDYTAAAKSLAAQGFGEKPKHVPPPRPTAPPRPSSPSTSLFSDAGPVPTPVLTNSAAPALSLVPDPEDHAPGVRTLRTSDNGNAMELIALHGEHIRYCYDTARWLTWDGVRWHKQPPGGGYARELVKDVAHHLPSGSKENPWQKTSLSAVGITNALTQAGTDPRVTVSLEQLDADAWALGTPTGIVDLRTGLRSPPDPEALCTKCTVATPDPAADKSAWESFLAVTFGGDQELIDYLQRLVGYSATGHVGPHLLPFAHGSGGNGKGVFLEAITGVLGDYATSAPNAFLMSRNYSPHETEIARLAGARMVLCSEVDETDKFDEAKVKQLTGGDTLTARFMRQDHFTFRPTHHLWLMGNYRPAVTSGGRSFWRRCRLIPFLHEVPPEREVDDLQGTFVADHAPAILDWIVQGAVEYARAGLQEPASVSAATAEYAHDQDTVGRFVEEMCHRAPGQAVVKVQVRDLFSEYDHWCTDTGEAAVTAKRLTQELRQRFGVGSVQSHGKRFYTGITLRSDRDEDGTSGTRSGPDERYR